MSSLSIKRGITITTHSPLGQEWVEQLGGMVVHSTYLHNPTTRFKVCYYTLECYQALQDQEVVPHLDACGLGKMRFKLPCFLNMDYAVQFVKNYNSNTKQSRIVSTNGQERTLTLSIDAVRNAYALEVMAEPYVDLRKLGNKLEGAANYESHKQRGGVKFVDISPHLQKLLTRVEPSDHHNIIPENHLLRLHKLQQHITNWADYFYQKLDKVCTQHNNIIQHPMLLMPLICHLAAWKLDKTVFGFANKSRVELQELVPQPEPKKQKLELVARIAKRSQQQQTKV